MLRVLKIACDKAEKTLLESYADMLQDGDELAKEYSRLSNSDNLFEYDETDDTLVINEVEVKSVPHIAFEYDESYSGGNYNDVGNFVYIPEPLLVYFNSKEDLFQWYTKLDKNHIVHYSDELYDSEGNVYEVKKCLD
jgi:hypothetical protein